MELPVKLDQCYLWLDVDGVIIDEIATKTYLSTVVFNKLVPNGAIDFWETYRTLIGGLSQVSFGEALQIWVKKHYLNQDSVVQMIKDLDFEKLVYDDFIRFIPYLREFKAFGFFTSGTIWFQKEKVFDIEKTFQKMGLTPKAVLASEDKTQLFSKMREFSQDLTSLYADDRLPFLERALRGGFVDLGVLMDRKIEIKRVEDKKILVIENFDNLMEKLQIG